MRILIKGGIWKNTEDEILKAAVMKYGKNQWSRVASLLTRKSSKQCKARWYEWLDPSIKKTEWTREEEEKLLHLAKLIPNQWRTIAPIVGRTAGQCMEHYERLLDQVQDSNAEVPSDDPRRLRPGEIDPTPETKPARPDPIDMDEDEKEMLSEARARLANTKGKKAKRKARERQLQESKRLALLQKRRELKMAGVETKINVKKRKFVDYVAEIPFQSVPPKGPYEVSNELVQTKQALSNPLERVLEISKLEGKHAKEEEDRLKQLDKKKMKMMLKEDAPAVISKLEDINDPTSLIHRTKISLPAPVINENELEEIVRVGQLQSMAPPIGGFTKQSTSTLLSEYNSNFLSASLSTPMRTPKQSEDILLQEARNQLILREMTPLVDKGYNNDNDYDTALPELLGGTGFDGINPRRLEKQTPSVFPIGTPSGSIASKKNSNIKQTPLRDNLGLNDKYLDKDYDNDMISISNYSITSKQNSINIVNQLKNLPEPEYSYEITIPDLPNESNDSNENRTKVLDAVDIEKQNLIEKLKNEEIELSRRSQVVKLNLPRPKGLNSQILTKIYNKIDESISNNEYKDINNMITYELIQLILYDQCKYPDQSITGAMDRVEQVDLPFLDDDLLKSAKELINEEIQSNNNSIYDINELKSKLIEISNDRIKSGIMFIPTRGEYDIPKNKSEMLTALATSFNSIKGKIEKESKKASKLENKLQITTQGYIKRCQALEKSIIEQYNILNQVDIELVCYENLLSMESRVIPHRLQSAKNEAIEAENIESKLQQKYSKLKEIILTLSTDETTDL